MWSESYVLFQLLNSNFLSNGFPSVSVIHGYCIYHGRTFRSTRLREFYIGRRGGSILTLSTSSNFIFITANGHISFIKYYSIWKENKN